jgi:hypothetical protein
MSEGIKKRLSKPDLRILAGAKGDDGFQWWVALQPEFKQKFRCTVLVRGRSLS